MELAHMTSESLRPLAVVAAVHVQGRSPAVRRHRHIKVLTMIATDPSSNAIKSCLFLAHCQETTACMHFAATSNQVQMFMSIKACSVCIICALCANVLRTLIFRRPVAAAACSF